ncbi:PREDICTED: vasodilator-stimulated phosphoprotein-like [Priapulus caudatus]|uniref:Vasodilator-stimulated phosphoprotein-like n=1 Tax=Priapulus caudatus TaxID=37621 RepID=A0ABM1EKV4_PRICU|nr:PREDICTED: vasodilator-stimulated phosphoprotein-like [Priapulus caudatus]
MLAGAKPLKKTGKASEGGGGGGSAAGNGGSKPPIGGSSGGNFMSEMQATLRKRLKQVEQVEPTNEGDSVSPNESSTPPAELEKPSWKKNSNGSSPVKTVPPALNGLESPKAAKKFQVGSAISSSCDLLTSNGPGDMAPDLEQLKQEILEEVRREMQKVKLEIIEAIKEMGKR